MEKQIITPTEWMESWFTILFTKNILLNLRHKGGNILPADLNIFKIQNSDVELNTKNNEGLQCDTLKQWI